LISFFRGLFAALVSTTIVSVSVIGVNTKFWPFMKGIEGGESFGDLKVLLALADFLRENPGMDPYQEDWSNSGMNPNYPLLMPRFFAWVGIGTENLFFLGFAQIILLCLVLSLAWWKFSQNLMTFPSVFLFGLVFSALALSPPVWLGIERGNYDVLIFCVVTFIALYFRDDWTTFAMIVFASVIKFFPLTLASLFLLRRRKRIALFIAPIVLLLLYLGFYFNETIAISSNTPRVFWASFGQFVPSDFVSNYLPALGLWGPAIIFIAIHGLAFSAAHSTLSDRSLLRSLEYQDTSLGSSLVFVGSLTSISAYLLGNSFDYRLIFFILPCLGVVLLLGLSEQISQSLLLATVIMLFTSYPAWQLSFVGDVLCAYLFAVYATLIWKFLKNEVTRKKGHATA